MNFLPCAYAVCIMMYICVYMYVTCLLDPIVWKRVSRPTDLVPGLTQGQPRHFFQTMKVHLSPFGGKQRIQKS